MHPAFSIDRPMMLTHTGRVLLVALSALALALSALVALSGAAEASHPEPGPAPTGCPTGAVCLYPDDSWNHGEPSQILRSYGGHNIDEQYGRHRLFNNQTGGAKAYACPGMNGTTCGSAIKPGEYIDYNLTPVNSIKLRA